jgi:arylsulfatase A-like enzyme
MKMKSRKSGFLFVRNAVISLSLFASVFSNHLTAATTSGSKPNIIVILVDDMGFSDVGCYGSEIPTPNIDKLASEGLRFTQFYNTGRCCPTRASLLTGLYPHQAGVGHMMEDGGQPGYQGHLNNQCVTIAEVLDDAGYFTAMTGKWHLGHAAGVEPWTRGFQRNLTSAKGGFYFADTPGADLFFNGKKYSPHDPMFPKDWYSSDLWTDYGLRFIDEAREAKKPFFLYLAHNAAHFPLQAPAEDIAKFRGKYKMSWDKLREQRRAKQIEMGITDKSWPLSPRPEMVKAWDSLSDDEKDRFDNIMAIYAAVISRMDSSIGTLVDGLKQRGILDNTLILFMSDNGGNAESGPNGRLDGKDPGSAHSVVFCGQSWATLENTPFRRYKHFNHEGGIATPLIVHWPAGFKAHNELRTQPGHLIDIMATCVDVSGAKYPTEFKGEPIPPMEGRSLVPAFNNKPIKRDAIYWEHEGNAAVRVGDWKLVRFQRKGDWELYNMKADRTELHDLAAEQPERVKEMATKWETWAERAHVKPYPKEENQPVAQKPKKKKAKAAKKEAASVQ